MVVPIPGVPVVPVVPVVPIVAFVPMLVRVIPGVVGVAAGVVVFRVRVPTGTVLRGHSAAGLAAVAAAAAFHEGRQRPILDDLRDLLREGVGAVLPVLPVVLHVVAEPVRALVGHGRRSLLAGRVQGISGSALVGAARATLAAMAPARIS